MNNNKIFYIIAGANGSGKTTLAKKILQNKKIEIINADEIAKDLNPDNIDMVKVRAGKIAINKINTLLDIGCDFSIETTLSGNFLEKIIEKAKKLNYEIKLLYVFLDNYNICINRVKSRFYNGGHDIPVEDIIRRYIRSKKNFIKYTYLTDSFELYYNGEENLTLIADNSEIFNNNLYNLFLEGVENEK